MKFSFVLLAFWILVQLTGLDSRAPRNWPNKIRKKQRSSEYSRVRKLEDHSEIRYQERLLDFGVYNSIQLRCFPSKKERFEIHLHSVTNRRTIPLLISFRPSENDIVFNSMVRGVWDHEHRRIVPVDLSSVFTIEVYLFPIHFLVVINGVWFHQQHYSHDVKHVEMVTVLGEVVVREVKTFTFEVLNEEANEPRKYDNTFVRYALPDEDPIPPTTEPAETATEAEEGPIESEEQPSQYAEEEAEPDVEEVAEPEVEEEAEPEVEEEEAPEALINFN
ncbi:hypothetical protein B9Z55_027575 [Caenorhabditis nigoni]|uniref:Galectin n=1 Tax=Caenorhabditis nigoni TaxID=1611254 RepID=A0A2G5SFJ5_9PELO|nr:hypothetical protein B9Z55_027575 [Caenorhabditis nigoni]